jgi:hypothetical protein
MIRLTRSRAFRACVLAVALASLSITAVALAHGRDHRGQGDFHARHFANYSGWVDSSSSASTLVIRNFRGKLRSFDVGSGTSYFYSDGSSASAANATPNTVVNVKSTAPTTSGGNRVAQRVIIRLASLAGEVTSNVGGVIKIADTQGFSHVINTSGSTICRQGGGPIACGSIPAGSVIVAVGKVDPDGVTLDATRVHSHTSS